MEIDTPIICNGNPKAGRHALIKCVELLGTPHDRGETSDHCISGHWPLNDPPPPGRHIHIIRNPRNMLISWVRFTRGEFAPGYLIAAFKSYYLNQPIYEEFSGYAGWLADPDVLNIRFEDLLGDDGVTVCRIADFLETPLLPGIMERLPRGTVTWSGKLSHWPDYWSDEIDTAWKQARGPEIEAMFGYG